MKKLYIIILLLILISCGKNQLNIHIGEEVHPYNLKYNIYSGDNLYTSGNFFSNTEEIDIGEGEFTVVIANNYEQDLESRTININSPPFFWGPTKEYNLYFLTQVHLLH